MSRLARGYPPPPSFLEPYPIVPGQYPFLPGGGYDGYDHWACAMDHTKGFVLQPGVQLSPHKDTEGVDVFPAKDPAEVRAAPQPRPVEVLSGSQLGGALVGTHATVESTPQALGPRVSRAPDRFTPSGPRHPVLRKPKRGRTGGGWDVVTTEEVLRAASKGSSLCRENLTIIMLASCFHISFLYNYYYASLMYNYYYAWLVFRYFFFCVHTVTTGSL